MYSLFAVFLIQFFSISGIVNSNHFEKLEHLDVEMSNWSKSGRLQQKQFTIQVHSDSSFSLEIEKPGIYRISIGAPYHEYVFTDYYVDKKGESMLQVNLDAVPLVNQTVLRDTNFSSWIDVVGNFNDWNFDSAQKLVYDENIRGITTTIKTDLDTIWYHITGLGVNVLPEADFYGSKNLFGNKAPIAGILNRRGSVTISFVPENHPFPLPSRKSVGIEVLQQRRTEEYFDRYFQFSSSQEELIAKKLTQMRYFDSGFHFGAFFGTFESRPSKKFERFNLVLDSLYAISSNLPEIENQTALQRLQQFEFVLAGIHQMAAESLLESESFDTPFYKKSKQWDHFLEACYSFGGAHPLWPRMMFHRIGFVKMISVEPKFWDLFEAISLQTSDYIFSMEMLYDVGTKAFEDGNVDLAKKCLTVMEQRHPNAQILSEFRKMMASK